MNISSLVDFRRYLHAHPELSGKEVKTASAVETFIKQFNPSSVLSSIGGSGLVATWDSGIQGDCLVFRSELDALPISEALSLDYKSTVPGVSHKCGHDGHATILCGVAKYLSENPISRGKVRLLFQPAEETGTGAQLMLNDTRWDFNDTDFIFALHNLPGYPLNQVLLKSGSFTAAVTSLVYRFKGYTSHAAEPEKGKNPALAISLAMIDILQLNIEIGGDDLRVITPVHMELGEPSAYGISAGEGALHFTIRTGTSAELESLEKRMAEIATKYANQFGLSLAISNLESFASTFNNDEATILVREAAIANNVNIVNQTSAFKWGEDFGVFTQQWPGCMFGLGAGINTPPLHHPDYDFPDELIDTGVSLFTTIIGNRLN